MLALDQVVLCAVLHYLAAEELVFVAGEHNHRHRGEAAATRATVTSGGQSGSVRSGSTTSYCARARASSASESRFTLLTSNGSAGLSVSASSTRRPSPGLSSTSNTLIARSSCVMHQRRDERQPEVVDCWTMPMSCSTLSGLGDLTRGAKVVTSSHVLIGSRPGQHHDGGIRLSSAWCLISASTSRPSLRGRLRSSSTRSGRKALGG